MSRVLMAESIPTDSLGAFRAPAPPTAKQINDEHLLACRSAEDAVEHAIKCGHLLLVVKKLVSHGEFRAWITDNCSFGQSTASLYMKSATENAKGVAYASLRHYFPSGRVSSKKDETSNKSETSSQISNAVSTFDEPSGELENAVIVESPDYVAMTRRDLDLIYEWRTECELMAQYTQEINAALGRVLASAELWLAAQ
jgi:Protein of unknown function (DUF3102)